MTDMKPTDTFALAWGTLAQQPRRTALIGLAMSIGVGAVVVLTALGEGARGYVLAQFAGLGSNLVIVIPGRAETTGAAPGVLSGQTTRDLTLADADAVARCPVSRRGAAECRHRAGHPRQSRSRGGVAGFDRATC
jgi:putative ABC transport system permease protein